MDSSDSNCADGTMVRASEIKEFMFQLRTIARRLLAGERQDCSVVATMLVHSAFFRNTIKNNEWTDVTWANRRHFFSDMVRAMRRSLIERVRRHRAAKRPQLVFFDPSDMPVDFSRDLEHHPERLVLLEEAMEILEKERPDLVEIIRLHYFVGLTTGEIAALLALNEKTVDRRLQKARVLLAEQMEAISSRASQT